MCGFLSTSLVIASLAGHHDIYELRQPTPPCDKDSRNEWAIDESLLGLGWNILMLSSAPVPIRFRPMASHPRIIQWTPQTLLISLWMMYFPPSLHGLSYKIRIPIVRTQASPTSMFASWSTVLRSPATEI